MLPSGGSLSTKNRFDPPQKDTHALSESAADASHDAARRKIDASIHPATVHGSPLSTRSTKRSPDVKPISNKLRDSQNETLRHDQQTTAAQTPPKTERSALLSTVWSALDALTSLPMPTLEPVQPKTLQLRQSTGVPKQNIQRLSSSTSPEASRNTLKDQYMASDVVQKGAKTRLGPHLRDDTAHGGDPNLEQHTSNASSNGSPKSDFTTQRSSSRRGTFVQHPEVEKSSRDTRRKKNKTRKSGGAIENDASDRVEMRETPVLVERDTKKVSRKTKKQKEELRGNNGNVSTVSLESQGTHRSSTKSTTKNKQSNAMTLSTKKSETVSSPPEVSSDDTTSNAYRRDTERKRQERSSPKGRAWQPSSSFALKPAKSFSNPHQVTDGEVSQPSAKKKKKKKKCSEMQQTLDPSAPMNIVSENEGSSRDVPMKKKKKKSKRSSPDDDRTLHDLDDDQAVKTKRKKKLKPKSSAISELPSPHQSSYSASAGEHGSDKNSLGPKDSVARTKGASNLLKTEQLLTPQMNTRTVSAVSSEALASSQQDEAHPVTSEKKKKKKKKVKRPEEPGDPISGIANADSTDKTSRSSQSRAKISTEPVEPSKKPERKKKVERSKKSSIAEIQSDSLDFPATNTERQRLERTHTARDSLQLRGYQADETRRGQQAEPDSKNRRRLRTASSQEILGNPISVPPLKLPPMPPTLKKSPVLPSSNLPGSLPTHKIPPLPGVAHIPPPPPEYLTSVKKASTSESRQAFSDTASAEASSQVLPSFYISPPSSSSSLAAPVLSSPPLLSDKKTPDVDAGATPKSLLSRAVDTLWSSRLFASQPSGSHESFTSDTLAPALSSSQTRAVQETQNIPKQAPHVPQDTSDRASVLGFQQPALDQRLQDQRLQDRFPQRRLISLLAQDETSLSEPHSGSESLPRDSLPSDAHPQLMTPQARRVNSQQTETITGEHGLDPQDATMLQSLHGQYAGHGGGQVLLAREPRNKLPKTRIKISHERGDAKQVEAGGAGYRGRQSGSSASYTASSFRSPASFDEVNSVHFQSLTMNASHLLEQLETELQYQQAKLDRLRIKEHAMQKLTRTHPSRYVSFQRFKRGSDATQPLVTRSVLLHSAGIGSALSQLRRWICNYERQQKTHAWHVWSTAHYFATLRCRKEASRNDNWGLAVYILFGILQSKLRQGKLNIMSAPQLKKIRSVSQCHQSCWVKIKTYASLYTYLQQHLSRKQFTVLTLSSSDADLLSKLGLLPLCSSFIEGTSVIAAITLEKRGALQNKHTQKNYMALTFLGPHASRQYNALPAYRLSKIDTNELYNIQTDPSVGLPFSNDAQATLTDFYQITMMYAYWKAGRHLDDAVFDVSFRKCPFSGEFAIMAGTSEIVRFVNSVRFTPNQLDYLRRVLPMAEDAFFDYLGTVDGSALQIYSIKEGTMVFPRIPVVRIQGPLGIAQLIETTVLNLLNFPTLVATNAARHRLVAGADKQLLEFGARRAQGPDGAMSASRYAYLGGFDATSNVRAGHLFNIPIRGTHAHAFVSSFAGLDGLRTRALQCADPPVQCDDFVAIVLSFRKKLLELWPSLNAEEVMNIGELAAFIAYAQAFPTSFLTLVDTYDTLASALHSVGIMPIGVRLDSGDLAYYSQQTRKLFCEVSSARLQITASNGINEAVIIALNDQHHEIDTFGIGTNLVTCQTQPALGMVYKLAEINGRPCMKLSQELEKTSVPAKKVVYRLYTKTGEPVVDLIQEETEKPPQPGNRIFCCHLFDGNKRCFVVPRRVEPLLTLVWDRGTCAFRETLEESRARCKEQLAIFRKDILRTTNPTPYKVSASPDFYRFFCRMWEETAPIFTLE